MGEPQGTEQGREPRVLQWEGPGPLPHIPEKNFAVFMLEEMAAARGDSVAVVDAETQQQRTYSELRDLVPRMSAGLAAAGVGLGHKVFFYTVNHTDCPLVFLAVIHRGATVVSSSPIHDKMKEEVVHSLKESDAQWAVVHASLLGVAEEAFSLLPPGTIKKVWVVGSGAGRPNITDLMTYDPLPPVTQEDGLKPALSAAQMLFSSGTTGTRKGVLFSHRGEISKVMMMKHFAKTHQLEKSSMREAFSRSLVVLPVTHSYGQSCLLNILMFGGTAVLTPVTMSAILTSIQKFKITMAPLVPTHWDMLLDTPLLQQYDLSSLQVIYSGGTILNTSLAKSLKQKVSLPLRNAWGMTEINAPATLCVINDDYKDGCIGFVLPYYEIKVVDVSSGEMVGPGVHGELHLRGPSSLLGYSNNPEATASLKDAEGWLHTGDYGYYDQDGLLYISGRIKELIKVMGYQVQPSDLEQVLLQHQHVAEAAVVGVPDKRTGQAPRAFVVLRPGASVQPSEVLQFVNDRVADVKKLTAGLWVVEAIPKNETGKVLRGNLEAGEVNVLAKC